MEKLSESGNDATSSLKNSSLMSQVASLHKANFVTNDHKRGKLTGAQDLINQPEKVRELSHLSQSLGSSIEDRKNYMQSTRSSRSKIKVSDSASKQRDSVERSKTRTKAKVMSSTIYDERESQVSSLPGTSSKNKGSSVSKMSSTKRTRHEARTIYSSNKSKPVDLRDKDHFASGESSADAATKQSSSNYEFNGVPLDKFMAQKYPSSFGQSNELEKELEVLKMEKGKRPRKPHGKSNPTGSQQMNEDLDFSTGHILSLKGEDMGTGLSFALPTSVERLESQKASPYTEPEQLYSKQRDGSLRQTSAERWNKANSHREVNQPIPEVQDESEEETPSLILKKPLKSQSRPTLHPSTHGFMTRENSLLDLVNSNVYTNEYVKQYKREKFEQIESCNNFNEFKLPQINPKERRRQTDSQMTLPPPGEKGRQRRTDIKGIVERRSKSGMGQYPTSHHSQNRSSSKKEHQPRTDSLMNGISRCLQGGQQGSRLGLKSKRVDANAVCPPQFLKEVQSKREEMRLEKKKLETPLKSLRHQMMSNPSHLPGVDDFKKKSDFLAKLKNNLDTPLCDAPQLLSQMQDDGLEGPSREKKLLKIKYDCIELMKQIHKQKARLQTMTYHLTRMKKENNIYRMHQMASGSVYSREMKEKADASAKDQFTQVEARVASIVLELSKQRMLWLLSETPYSEEDIEEALQDEAAMADLKDQLGVKNSTNESFYLRKSEEKAMKNELLVKSNQIRGLLSIQMCDARSLKNRLHIQTLRELLSLYSDFSKANELFSFSLVIKDCLLSQRRTDKFMETLKEISEESSKDKPVQDVEAYNPVQQDDYIAPPRTPPSPFSNISK